MPTVKRFDRIHVSCGRLVVPPFGCAWLSDSESQIKSESACIIFEVCGETDATILLKARPGSRRWQHLQKKQQNKQDPVSREDSYVIIFGSHRNTLLRIERNGVETYCLRTSWSRISPQSFSRFWICYISGVIYVGSGNPSRDCGVKWEDPNPLRGIQYVGMSAWDKHCTFRNIRVEPCIPWLQLTHKMPSLFDICVSTLLDDLDISKACCILLRLDQMDMPCAEQLRKRASVLVAKNFEDFAHDYVEAFSLFSSTTICSILRSSELSADERLVFNSVVLWMFNGDRHHDQKQMRSSTEINEVLKWVRFTLIDSTELIDILSAPLASLSPEICCAIQQALSVQAHASDSDVNLIPSDESVLRNREFSEGKMELDFFWKRAVPNGVQLQYSYDGDKNGVSNYLGRDCGTKPWKNPMTSKKLTVKASSPSNRWTSPKDIVGDKFLWTNYAGPKRVNNNLVTWWLMDLQDKVLFCSYYTIRHDASSDFFRFWDFQGSEDNENWTSLRKHENDGTINAPGCFGSWPIYCSAKPYRMFRLLLTGPTDSLTAPHNMSLSKFEIYGTLMGPGIV